MSVPGGNAEKSFGLEYTSALRDYLLEPDEGSLQAGYELGRQAVSRGLSVLRLALAHQDALGSVLAEVDEATQAKRIAGAAGDFFLESLSSFEMVQRGFKEAREALLLERRQTVLSRRLSSFLADASLALDASDSLEEMLRLVAEQARELVGTECCVVTLVSENQTRVAEASSHAESDRRWVALLRWLDLPAILRVLRIGDGSVRITGEQLERSSPFRSTGAGSGRELRGWLASLLTTLEGGELGAIQLFDKQVGNFSAEDEAGLVHLAQMASAAVERTRLYRPGS